MLNYSVWTPGVAKRLKKQTCDQKIAGSISWTDRINLGGESEKQRLPPLITTLSKALNQTAPVELLSGQQITLWLYWSASSVNVCKSVGDVPTDCKSSLPGDHVDAKH